MKKSRLLPKLALMGITKNATVYFPYMGAGIFSVFAYFVFSTILHNDLIQTVPNSMYAWALLQVGRVLLALILLPFLYYANSFLIKSRKKEIGLYNVLGLEKKHIGTMLLLEAGVVFAVILGAGTVCGLVLSKLLFLLLLKMTSLPVEAAFSFDIRAFYQTAGYFAVVVLFNLIGNLWELRKNNGVELLSGSKRGEKEPRFIWLFAILGAALLAWGYQIAITSKIDGMIFMNFFLAVFLVVGATYLLITSGSIATLKLMKSRKKSYYTAKHFITVSGMLYRMKKSAASLVNICIFSTMVIITLLCTSSLYLGLEGIQKFAYPYDLFADFDKVMSKEELEQEVEKLAVENNVTITEKAVYDKIKSTAVLDRDSFDFVNGNRWTEGNTELTVLTLEDYNRMESAGEQLGEGEVLIYSTGEDYGFDSVTVYGKQFRVKKELKQMYHSPKATANSYQNEYFIVMGNQTDLEACMDAMAKQSGQENGASILANGPRCVEVNAEGTDQEKAAFFEAFQSWAEGREGFRFFRDNEQKRAEIASMNGGLLFIGILFGMVFFVCLILIMYYKQISEGYEDQKGFQIMQKVGMSETEIKKTVTEQILLVFAIPILGAVIHTAAAAPMIAGLLAAIQLYDTRLIIRSGIFVTIAFAVAYGIGYLFTARTYYRIVGQRITDTVS